jgi:hypothetical protein
VSKFYIFIKSGSPIIPHIKSADSYKVEFGQFSPSKSSPVLSYGNFCVFGTWTFLISSDIFCPILLFAVDVTVLGYRAMLLKQLSLFADECVPVEVGGNAANSNREPAGRWQQLSWPRLRVWRRCWRRTNSRARDSWYVKKVSDAFHKCGNLSALWREGVFIKFVQRQPWKINPVNFRTVLLLIFEWP